MGPRVCFLIVFSRRLGDQPVGRKANGFFVAPDDSTSAITEGE